MTDDSSDQSLFLHCGICGGRVVPIPGVGRTRLYAHGAKPVAIPHNALIPTCNWCGETYMGPEDSSLVDASVAWSLQLRAEEAEALLEQALKAGLAEAERLRISLAASQYNYKQAVALLDQETARIEDIRYAMGDTDDPIEWVRETIAMYAKIVRERDEWKASAERAEAERDAAERAARTLYDAIVGHIFEHDLEHEMNCPQDDTCECETLAEVEAALKSVAEVTCLANERAVDVFEPAKSTKKEP